MSYSEETPGRVNVTTRGLNGAGWGRQRQMRTLKDENRILARLACEIRADIERLQTLLTEHTKSGAKAGSGVDESIVSARPRAGA